MKADTRGQFEAAAYPRTVNGCLWACVEKEGAYGDFLSVSSRHKLVFVITFLKSFI